MDSDGQVQFDQAWGQHRRHHQQQQLPTPTPAPHNSFLSAQPDNNSTTTTFPMDFPSPPLLDESYPVPPYYGMPRPPTRSHRQNWGRHQVRSSRDGSSASSLRRHQPHGLGTRFLRRGFGQPSLSSSFPPPSSQQSRGAEESYLTQVMHYNNSQGEVEAEYNKDDDQAWEALYDYNGSGSGNLIALPDLSRRLLQDMLKYRREAAHSALVSTLTFATAIYLVLVVQKISRDLYLLLLMRALWLLARWIWMPFVLWPLSLLYLVTSAIYHFVVTTTNRIGTDPTSL